MIRSASGIHRPIGRGLGIATACLTGIVILGCNSNEPTQLTTPNSVTNVARTVKAENPDKASSRPIENKSSSKPIDDQPDVNDPAFHEGLLEAIDGYLQYSMMNSVVLEPQADSAPSQADSRPKMSKSDHVSTHGRKLYYLFAMDIAHYLSLDGTPSPEGQVLVKETWTSKPSNPDARNMRTHASGVRINPRVSVGEETIEIGKRKDLFVMMKLAPNTANTDNGWVYGVVDPNSQEVTASGKVASCMHCHQNAKNDRLFGTALDE